MYIYVYIQIGQLPRQTDGQADGWIDRDICIYVYLHIFVEIMAPNDGTPISLPLPYTPILFPFSKPGSQGFPYHQGVKKIHGYMDTFRYRYIFSLMDVNIIDKFPLDTFPLQIHFPKQIYTIQFYAFPIKTKPPWLVRDFPIASHI